MKVIGVLSRVNINEDGSKELEVLENYIKVLNSYDDVVPILILPTKDIYYNGTQVLDEFNYKPELLTKLDTIIDKCDGFLLPGGTNWYSYEEYVIKRALGKDKPILGICLGMQELGVLSARERLDVIDTTIKVETGFNHYQPGIDNVHKILINPNSLLYKIVEKTEMIVNSRHNYCIDNPGNMDINAISEDGVIESISLPNKKFVLGIQWHPENLFNNEDNKKIFDSFIESM